MNSNAYDILRAYDLPTPKIYSLEEVCFGPEDTSYYLRYRDSTKNLIMTGENCKVQAPTLSMLFSAGELLSIEATYDFIGGGVTLVRTGFSYTEYVVGHLSALLRRGVCGGRLLMSNCYIYCEEVFQGWIAKRDHLLGFYFLPHQGPSRYKLNCVAKCMAGLLTSIEPGLLLEWFETSDGLLFCDARDNGFQDFGAPLASLPDRTGPIVLSSRSRPSSGRVIIDGFDVDHRAAPQPGDSIQALNGALLSHYIMRSNHKDVLIQLGV